MARFDLRDICLCSTEQQLEILTIRNHDAVRKSMYTEHEIGVNEHLSWINRLKGDPKSQVFVVLKEGVTPVGTVSVNQIDRLHKKADWAFYLHPSEQGGLGSVLEFAVLDYVFDRLDLQKLNCEVLETNPVVVSLHKKFGFVEEGFRRSNIEKASGRIGVHLLGITRDEWKENRAAKQAALAEKLENIHVSFDFSERPLSQSVIDEIQSARARNNINWMALLRLSVESREQPALALITEIMKVDGEINKLTEKLVKEQR